MANVKGWTTNDTASGTIRFTDADPCGTHAACVASVSASGATAGLPANGTLLTMVTLGSLSEPSGATAGSLGWSFAAANKAFDYLAASQTVTLTFAVQVVDGQGGTRSQPVTVTITGTNDSLAIAASTSVSGSTPGASTWTFSAPEKTFDYLAAGQVATLSCRHRDRQQKRGHHADRDDHRDRHQRRSGARERIDHCRRDNRARRDLGVERGDAAAGIIKFTDENGDTHSAAITGVAASGTATGLPARATMLSWLGLGTLTEQASSTAGSLPWTFTAPDAAFDYLGAGKTATLTYTVRITDSQGAVMNQVVTVTAAGTNDAPTATTKSGYTTDNWTALTIIGATLIAGAPDPDSTDTLTLSSVEGAVTAASRLPRAMPCSRHRAPMSGPHRSPT